jgi:hypothetical protein
MVRHGPPSLQHAFIVSYQSPPMTTQTYGCGARKPLRPGGLPSPEILKSLQKQMLSKLLSKLS